jgi:DNA-binding beta-propeller fold protein YncE
MKKIFLPLILVSFVFYGCKKVEALLGANAKVSQVSVVLGFTGQDTVTVTGTNFVLSGQISGSLNGSPITVLSTSSSQIVATVDAGLSTNGDLILDEGTIKDTFPYDLSVNGMSFSSFGSNGSTITINGTGFSSGLNGLVITVDGSPYTVTSSSPTQVVATSGRVAVLFIPGEIVQVTVGPQIINTRVLFFIAGISPMNGTGGTEVSISGSGFSSNPALDTIEFNGTAATVTSATPQLIIASAPQGGTTGPVTVKIGNNTCIGPVFNYPEQVSTFAGSGTAGSADGLGSAASFKEPENGAFDANGNLFVADYGNNEIRKIDPTGNVTTFAGKTNSGFTNGTVSNALFLQPAGLVFDTQGNLYISDQGNNAIRKIDPQGNVTTFAGGGAVGNQDGKGTAAGFNGPIGIALDSVGGYLYVADAGNNEIRQINLATANVVTIAGSVGFGAVNGTGSQATFGSPRGITVFNGGGGGDTYLFIADYSNNMIREVIYNNGASIVSTMFGTQTPGSSPYPATFFQPNSVTQGIGTQGLPALYIADAGNHVIRVVDDFDATSNNQSDQLVPILAGIVGQPGLVNGNYSSAQFYYPDGVAYNPKDGNLYVIEFQNNDIRKIILQH